MPLSIAVAGLWHLGSVTAGCLASAGFRVMGIDDDAQNIAALKQGRPPVAEPGLQALIEKSLAAGNLTFTTDCAEVKSADVVWITYDTPVDEDDKADVDYVVDRIARLFAHLKNDALVVISSQLPVGSTKRVESLYRKLFPEGNARFIYSPENLRLGKAIQVFTQPDRVVVGVRNMNERERMTEVLKPFTSNIEWMSVESAEMTKHALNAFLATSVAFINEVASLCELVGADAREVERGLKTDIRIGKLSYLKPGPAFAGGTLARDISFLQHLGSTLGRPVQLLSGVRESNLAHKAWLRRRLTEVLGALAGKSVAVLGLTYKPGTDTLRRSSAVEICRWLFAQGVVVRAFDPAVKLLPPELASEISLCDSALSALTNADAALVATEWPEFQSLSSDSVVGAMAQPRVFDPSRFLENTMRADKRIHYFGIGGPA